MAIRESFLGSAMRSALLCFLAFFALSAPAWAQSQIVVRADPAPIVEAEINGRPVRLEVDLRLPDVLVLNPSAAERLGVRRIPFVAARVLLDDASIRGRIARPRIVFGQAGAARAITGVFNVPASERADGLIGPGVLPYDVIRVELRAPQANEREIVLAIADADVWDPRQQIGGLEMSVWFDLANDASTFNRTASARLDESGLIVADGAHTETAMLMGLRAQTQPIRTDISVQGLGLSPVAARTRAPLLGALDEDTIVVEGDADAPRPSLWIGRRALADCSSITVDRRSRLLTLRCAS